MCVGCHTMVQLKHCSARTRSRGEKKPFCSWFVPIDEKLQFHCYAGCLQTKTQDRLLFIGITTKSTKRRPRRSSLTSKKRCLNCTLGKLLKQPSYFHTWKRPGVSERCSRSHRLFLKSRLLLYIRYTYNSARPWLVLVEATQTQVISDIIFN